MQQLRLPLEAKEEALAKNPLRLLLHEIEGLTPTAAVQGGQMIQSIESGASLKASKNQGEQPILKGNSFKMLQKAWEEGEWVDRRLKVTEPMAGHGLEIMKLGCF